MKHKQIIRTLSQYHLKVHTQININTSNNHACHALKHHKHLKTTQKTTPLIPPALTEEVNVRDDLERRVEGVLGVRPQGQEHARVTG